ncbi:hypothetical protein SAICODRAFT_195068 [Saitoella complicata NRRL Y-17804]|uniref:uncharacterized protein n=1 Tax=Saitoella complicata (strain BCRC 22490 / CBS 7301 / JCM 7358 / NBRC 10748 / NRRL Y-17804) TaxID=698492 RepID=UPI000867AB3D|nr:uncharacterized protein SAICODRAFT_195068 [Saitoella complicata NRRL Y-17804]ODQ49663.1 hypothetical protein SAICODRAFT_195068 [Saitoella complicata NRRL Y-17804]
MSQFPSEVRVSVVLNSTVADRTHSHRFTRLRSAVAIVRSIIVLCMPVVGTAMIGNLRPSTRCAVELRTH